MLQSRLIAPAVLIFALAALAVPKLAVFAFVAAIIAWAAHARLSAENRTQARVDRWFLFAATLASGSAIVLFVFSEGMQGIVEAGTRASEQRAVSRLREILFAEDAMRTSAYIDPDRDKIGSAGFLGEITGKLKLRNRELLPFPILQGYTEWTSTSLGPAILAAGYLYAVCLPTPDGGFSANPEQAVDEERAERSFFIYAWPHSLSERLGVAFSLDEHENIRVAEAKAGLRLGPDHPPPCDDMLAPGSAAEWSTWRKKKPRKSLPGDLSETH